MKKRQRSSVVQWIGIAISIFCIAFMMRQVDINELTTALTHFDWQYLVIAMGSLSVGYALRIIRWGIMLRAAGAHVKNRACAVPFLGSIALNNVLPLRAGDLIRAFVFPASMGIRVATSTASLFLERLLDLMTLLLCLAFGIYMSHQVSLPESIKTGIFVLSLVVAIAFVAMFLFDQTMLSLFHRFASWAGDRGHDKVKKLFSFIAEFFKRLAEMLGVRQLLSVFILSVGVWVFEAGVFMAILKGLHLSVTWMDAIGIMAMTTLATLVPSSPGYVGPFHLVAYGALVALGISLSGAASFAIITHLTLWLPTTFVGSVAILCNRTLFQGITAQE